MTCFEALFFKSASLDLTCFRALFFKSASTGFGQSGSATEVFKSALLVQIRTSLRPNPHFPNPQFCEKKLHGRVSRLLLDLLAHFAQLFEFAKSVELKSTKSAFSNPHAFFCKSAKSAFSKSARVFSQIRQIRIFQIRTRFFVKSTKSAFSNPQAFFCQIRQIRIFKSASVFLSNPPNPHFQIRTGFGADLPCSELTDDNPGGGVSIRG